jgi:predicted kinase
MKKECKMKELILLRGLPGSGKSTFAKLFKTIEHYEADMFFMRGNGYEFDGSKLKEAHTWCQDLVLMAMKRSEPSIVVSNTFTQEWEMEVYYKLAKQFDYRVHSLIVENRHNGINEHGCPEDKIQAMKNRFQVKL